MKLPQLLMIAGTGRDSGKTTLACRIISKFSGMVPIVAIKTSRHRHKIDSGGTVLTQSGHLYMAEETEKGTGKDSSRMLEAGAVRSFFVVTDDDQLLPAIRQIIEISGNNALLICESGELRRWVEPGLFLIVHGPDSAMGGKAIQELTEFEHILITFDGHDFSYDLNQIAIHDNCWETKSGLDNF